MVLVKKASPEITRKLLAVQAARRDNKKFLSSTGGHTMSETTKIARRSFFAGLGLAAAAGVAVKLAPSATVEALSGPADEAEGKSYRLSEHVKKYYRTTTI